MADIPKTVTSTVASAIAIASAVTAAIAVASTVAETVAIASAVAVTAAIAVAITATDVSPFGSTRASDLAWARAAAWFWLTRRTILFHSPELCFLGFVSI